MARPISGILALMLICGGASAADTGPFEFASPSAVARGHDLEGRLVETRDGHELGRVEDFALDLASGRIAYVVVSVGSFLIDDSLIAVAPAALRASADPDGRLILEADEDSVRRAARFSAGEWPLRADVLAGGYAELEAPAPAAPDETATASRGTATISDGNKTATLSAGERSVRFVTPAPPPKTTATQATDTGTENHAAPQTRFDRLDSNGDGALDRAEIAHELSRQDRYTDIDSDGSGGVDRAEFDALVSRH